MAEGCQACLIWLERATPIEGRPDALDRQNIFSVDTSCGSAPAAWTCIDPSYDTQTVRQEINFRAPRISVSLLSFYPGLRRQRRLAAESKPFPLPPQEHSSGRRPARPL